MEDNKDTLDEKVLKYKAELQPLLKYIPYFAEKRELSQIYSGEGAGSSVSFPVYDSVFLSFVKACKASSFMDKNYRYVYTRNLIKSHEDEYRIIGNATIREWDVLCGILSNYILGGTTRPSLWSEGGKADIYGKCLEKMLDIVKFYDVSYGR